MIKISCWVVLILGVFLTTATQGQNLAEKIAIKACSYLDSIDNFKVLQDSIDPSITSATVIVIMEERSEEAKVIGSVEGIRETLKAAYEYLPSHCYNVRRLIIKDKKRKFYKRSASYDANKHYDKGNELMEAGDYKNAIKEFKSAVKCDNNFVYAIDHIAICYRRMGEYNTAIKYYKQSLEIFPEGDVAILNIAVSYSLIEDDNNSVKSYTSLKFLYPDDPEGYFGLGKILFLKGDYENALDNLFTAHRMYVDSKSDYIKDSKLLLDYMTKKLKEENRYDIFEKKAKENNIEIDQH